MLPRTPAPSATALAAFQIFGGSAHPYNGGGEIPAGQDLAAALVHETAASGGGF